VVGLGAADSEDKAVGVLGDLVDGEASRQVWTIRSADSVDTTLWLRFTYGQGHRAELRVAPWAPGGASPLLDVRPGPNPADTEL